jgi:molybdopterin molybdotransferase
MLSFSEAREKVIAVTEALRHQAARETLELRSACGRVLAERIVTDRDYPPFDRSTRDGFAVHAADASAGATLRCIGEIKAGGGFDGSVRAGECVQIMTGAAVPRGADAVVMIEYTRVAGQSITIDRGAERGQNIVPRGSEAGAGRELLAPGMRLGYAEMALAAQVGQSRVDVFARPRVAAFSTGDEVVDVTATPGPLQIRNSNGVALETLIVLAGGEPQPLGNASDEKGDLRRRMERGLETDLLVMSGGVSMGKYDLVEEVLAELGAEIFFDAVAMRPGRPAVFGCCRGVPVFGLPGNPISTMVTFELFVTPAIDVLGGAAARPLPIFPARLAHAVHERGEVAHLLPARVDRSSGEPQVSTLAWRGSGDTVTLAQANAFLIVPSEKLDWAAGEWAMVLPRSGPGGALC